MSVCCPDDPDLHILAGLKLILRLSIATLCKRLKFDGARVQQLTLEKKTEVQQSFVKTSTLLGQTSWLFSCEGWYGAQKLFVDAESEESSNDEDCMFHCAIVLQEFCKNGTSIATLYIRIKFNGARVQQLIPEEKIEVQHPWRLGVMDMLPFQSQMNWCSCKPNWNGFGISWCNKDFYIMMGLN